MGCTFSMRLRAVYAPADVPRVEHMEMHDAIVSVSLLDAADTTTCYALTSLLYKGIHGVANHYLRKACKVLYNRRLSNCAALNRLAGRIHANGVKCGPNTSNYHHIELMARMSPHTVKLRWDTDPRSRAIMVDAMVAAWHDSPAQTRDAFDADAWSYPNCAFPIEHRALRIRQFPSAHKFVLEMAAAVALQELDEAGHSERVRMLFEVAVRPLAQLGARSMPPWFTPARLLRVLKSYESLSLFDVADPTSIAQSSPLDAIVVNALHGRPIAAAHIAGTCHTCLELYIRHAMVAYADPAAPAACCLWVARLVGGIMGAVAEMRPVATESLVLRLLHLPTISVLREQRHLALLVDAWGADIRLTAVQRRPPSFASRQGVDSLTQLLELGLWTPCATDYASLPRFGSADAARAKEQWPAAAREGGWWRRLPALARRQRTWKRAHATGKCT